ncbi:MAG: hypothetical protein IJD27_01530 [Alistipes sp.]|nr:hypothetical protein [Alistipes sp.]
MITVGVAPTNSTQRLPFSECNERMPFYAIQRPTGAHAIYRCALTTFGVPP